jgi:hypothetical protein
MDATAELIKDLESTLGVWRNHVASNPAMDGFTRDAGFVSGLEVCIGQLAGTLDRYRANTVD